MMLVFSDVLLTHKCLSHVLSYIYVLPVGNPTHTHTPAHVVSGQQLARWTLLNPTDTHTYF